jgi:hypothetical protein
VRIYCYTYIRRVKRSEGKPLRFARTIRTMLIHPSGASASTALAGEVKKAWQLLRWAEPPARPPTTGAFLYASSPECSILPTHLSDACQLSGYAGRVCYPAVFFRVLKTAIILFQKL